MKIIAINNKINHEYFVIETYEAGLVLQGSEVKSCCNKGVNLEGSYVSNSKDNRELWLIGCNIEEYQNSRVQHELKRDRKLLLNKGEIKKLIDQTVIRGFTIIPVKMYFSDRGKIKVEIALCQGKKNYDQRQALRQKDAEKQIKNYF